MDATLIIFFTTHMQAPPPFFFPHIFYISHVRNEVKGKNQIAITSIILLQTCL